MANEEILDIDIEKFKEYERKAKAFDFLIIVLEQSKEHISNYTQPSYDYMTNWYDNFQNENLMMRQITLPKYQYKIETLGNESLSKIILDNIDKE